MWSQYARQLSYVQCLITNSISSSSAICDCEKIKTEVVTGENNLPHSKNHTHHSIDEWYTQWHVVPLNRGSEHLNIVHSSYYSVNFCKGVLQQQYRPPQC
jgi:hypothetical protein